MSLIKISESISKNKDSNNHSSEKKTHTLGIDFGTTNSLVCISNKSGDYLASIKKNPVKIDRQNPTQKINNDVNFCLIPSVVAINKSGEIYVGHEAVNLQNNSDFVIIKSIKSFFTIKSSTESQSNKKLFNFDLMDDRISIYADSPIPSLVIFGKIYTCCEIASWIFKHLKQIAEKSFCKFGIKNCKSIVLTVPAYFNEDKKRLIRQSAELANLKVRRIITEPAAAALAYNKNSDLQANYLVYDLGGGTFDVSILQFFEGIVRILSIRGDTKLGGDNFDSSLHCLLKKKYNQKLKILTLSELSSLIEQIKFKLSFSEVFKKEVKSKANKSIRIQISRNEYNSEIIHLVKKTINHAKEALYNAEIEESELKYIIFVGGSTRNQIITEQIKKNFPNAKILKYIQPDIAVALGAGLHATTLDSKGEGDILLNVNPLSLGIEVMGGMIEKIIPRNIPVPISAEVYFTTYKDNQKKIQINVFQGERELTKYSHCIGRFVIQNPLNNNKKPKIKVSFNIDEDGLLNVSAEIEETKSVKKISIDSLDKLNIQDIKNNVMDAILNRESDKKTITDTIPTEE